MIFPAPCELPEFETIMDALEKSIAIAKASNDAACSCKGIRFKTCASCGQPAPPGTKIARRIMKARGMKWNGEVFHGGELTLAAFNKRNPFPAKTYTEMLQRKA